MAVGIIEGGCQAFDKNLSIITRLAIILDTGTEVEEENEVSR